MNILELKSHQGSYLSSLNSNITNAVTEWLNPKLLYVDEDKMEFEFLVRPEMTDPLGILHGSIRAAMLCDSLGIFANHPGYDVSAITTNMNIDFIGKAYAGEKVKLIAEIVKKGSNLIYMSGTILNEKEQIVARGSTTLFVISK